MDSNKNVQQVMPLPRYKTLQNISRSYLRMTGMIPMGVPLKMRNPLRNFALGIQHILAVYDGRLLTNNKDKDGLYTVIAKTMGCGDWKLEDARVYLIQRDEEMKVLRPSRARDIVLKTLEQYSTLCLERVYQQTPSWKRILGPRAETGTYIIFFIVIRNIGEEMFDAEQYNDGEYLRIAVCDTTSRLLCPCNQHGSAHILGRDLKDLCSHVYHTTEVTDLLNYLTCGRKCGIYWV